MNQSAVSDSKTRVLGPSTPLPLLASSGSPSHPPGLSGYPLKLPDPPLPACCPWPLTFLHLVTQQVELLATRTWPTLLVNSANPQFGRVCGLWEGARGRRSKRKKRIQSSNPYQVPRGCHQGCGEVGNGEARGPDPRGTHGLGGKRRCSDKKG